MKASPIWQSFSLGTLLQPISAADFGLSATAAAMAVSVIAIFNSTGRILWGIVSDKIGRKITLIVIFVLCGIALIGSGSAACVPVLPGHRLADRAVLRRIPRALPRPDRRLLRDQDTSA